MRSTLNAKGLPIRSPLGWYALHCDECGVGFWARHVRVLSRRCRECGGVIRPGTVSHWLSYLEGVEARKAERMALQTAKS